MRSVKVILVKNKDTDTHGYLKIQIIENRKKTLSSLKIKLHEKNWLSDRERVKKAEPEAEKYNTIIETRLRELHSFDSIMLNNANKSLLAFFETIITRTSNHGSRTKLETVKNKFVEFLANNKKTDISFAEFTTNIIYAFQNYCLKTMSVNTTNHYLKMIKTTLNKASKERYYTYTYNPFLPIEFKNKKVKKKALTESDIKVLVKSDLVDDTSHLYKYRQCLLFMTFAAGMRISDFQLLRFRNIVGDKINYQMLKNGTEMSVHINPILTNILIYFIRLKFPDELKVYDNSIKRIKAKYVFNVEMKSLRESYGVTPTFISADEENLISEMPSEILKESEKFIGTFSKKYPDSFIAPFLNDNELDFDKLYDNTKITEEQYNRVKNKTIVYNRNLKELQKVYDIKGNLTAHTARHSFAMILMKDNVNISLIKMYKVSRKWTSSGRMVREFLAGLQLLINITFSSFFD